MSLIILDCDGVINQDSKAYIKSPEEWHPIPGSLEALGLLTQLGFRVAVVTNQSGIGRGLYTQETLDKIHEKMHRSVAATSGKIDVIFYCPHAPHEHCACRKPKPGLLYKVRDYFGCALEGVWLVGDSLRDLLSAEAASCQPVLVKTGNGLELLEKKTPLPSNTLCFDDLKSVAEYLAGIQSV